ncbi:MAG TPA: hypothetical protein DCG38_01415 [Eubacteriaceae bacterium]|jgi:hypothetical protein|nr:hypothetical protein [Eubacteriaceae bacterium]
MDSFEVAVGHRGPTYGLKIQSNVVGQHLLSVHIIFKQPAFVKYGLNVLKKTACRIWQAA